jgi:hypothetical protein
MDQMDAITLLYLLKTADAHTGQVTLEKCADEFLRTKAELQKFLSQQSSDALKGKVESGNFSF